MILLDFFKRLKQCGGGGGGNLPGFRLQAKSAQMARRMRRETPSSPRVQV
jgi:hypothetical protein